MTANLPAGRAGKRVLSGMRPTGRLHLGHLVGALENWVKLQDPYQCFFFVADWHALTTDYADTHAIPDNTVQMIIDWLAAGLDPEKSTLFLQSYVPAHAELHLLFSMVTPLGWLERVPSYKEQRENIRDKDLGTYGFLGYPVLQAADILIYKANFVPVGEDQQAHVELTREIARRFNYTYPFPNDSLFGAEGREALSQLCQFLPDTEARRKVEADQVLSGDEIGQLRGDILAGVYRRGQPPVLPEIRGRVEGISSFFDVFPEPGVLLTPTPKLPGLDGRKMSKSYGNTIELGEEPDSIRRKVSNMLTDPQRKRRTDPGRPEVCPVFGYHQRYSTSEVVAQVDRDCRTAQIGCVDCKKLMAQHLIPALEPIRARRRHYENKPGLVGEILVEGSKKAAAVAAATMDDVRQAMQMVLPWEKKSPRGAGARTEKTETAKATPS